MDSQNRTMLKVLCPVENEKKNKTYWMRVGTAFVNRDGSTNVYLDAYPSNGKLQIRELDERDLNRDADRSRAGTSVGASMGVTADGVPF